MLRSGIGAVRQRPVPPSGAPKAVPTFGLPLGDNPQGFLCAVHGTPRNARFLGLGLNILGWARPIAENISKKLLGLSLSWPVARIFVCGKHLVSGARNALAIPKDRRANDVAR